MERWRESSGELRGATGVWKSKGSDGKLKRWMEERKGEERWREERKEEERWREERLWRDNGTFFLM